MAGAPDSFPARYRVRARNTATASANKIHDDRVARQLGFAGGLVPGVDVYAYLCHLPAERWGRDWLERGTMLARFSSPVYDHDEVEIQGTAHDDRTLALVLRDPSGARCAEGRAALSIDRIDPPPIDDWPGGEPPPAPPPASPEILTSVTFGRLHAHFRAERSHDYLDDVGERLSLFRDGRIAHPGWLLRFANYVLTANVTLGPWIHVESSVSFFDVVTDGERVETRARVTREYERKGHRFVDLDVLQHVGDRPVARTAHSAIYRPRGT